jgi:hypothetical protein
LTLLGLAAGIAIAVIGMYRMLMAVLAASATASIKREE